MNKPKLLSQCLWALFFAATIELESGYFKAFFIKLRRGDAHPLLLIFLMGAFGFTIAILIRTLENKKVNPLLCAAAVCLVLIASTWIPTE
jgi:hypothetical protein